MNKILRKIKYPKFLLFILTVLIAYILFNGSEFVPFRDFLSSLGYLGTFFAGVFYAYGFTAAPATAILLILAKEQNIILAGLIAGFGALLADLLIFKFVRNTFGDEIEKLSEEKIIIHLGRKMPDSFKKYLLPVLGGFIVASPLPDEIGVTILSMCSNLSTRIFSVVSYILNTTGIFAILIIGTLI